MWDRAPSLQPLTNKMRLRVRDDSGSEWREVAVPRSVRALVLLNIQVGALLFISGLVMATASARLVWLMGVSSLFWTGLVVFHGNRASPVAQPSQSYGGGRDIVGLGDTTLLRGQEFKQAPIFDDGLIEVCSPFGSRLFDGKRPCMHAVPMLLVCSGQACWCWLF